MIIEINLVAGTISQIWDCFVHLSGSPLVAVSIITRLVIITEADSDWVSVMMNLSMVMRWFWSVGQKVKNPAAQDVDPNWRCSPHRGDGTRVTVGTSSPTSKTAESLELSFQQFGVVSQTAWSSGGFRGTHGTTPSSPRVPSFLQQILVLTRGLLPVQQNPNLWPCREWNWKLLQLSWNCRFCLDRNFLGFQTLRVLLVLFFKRVEGGTRTVLAVGSAQQQDQWIFHLQLHGGWRPHHNCRLCRMWNSWRSEVTLESSRNPNQSV